MMTVWAMKWPCLDEKLVCKSQSPVWIGVLPGLKGLYSTHIAVRYETVRSHILGGGSQIAVA